MVPDSVVLGRFFAHAHVGGHEHGNRWSLSPDHTMPVPPHSEQHLAGCGAGAGPATGEEKASQTATVALVIFII
jgi:hypothetical protein